MDRSSRSRNIRLCEDQIRLYTPSDCSVCVCELWYVAERRMQCDYQKAVGSKR